MLRGGKGASQGIGDFCVTLSTARCALRRVTSSPRKTGWRHWCNKTQEDAEEYKQHAGGLHQLQEMELPSPVCRFPLRSLNAQMFMLSYISIRNHQRFGSGPRAGVKETWPSWDRV